MRFTIGCCLLLPLLVSCAGSSRYMVRDATPDSHEPPAGQSMIVFVRPSGVAYALQYTVIDEMGGFIGQVPSKGHVKHVTDSGRHRYILWSNGTGVMDVDMAADKTYYVYVPANGGDLLPIKRGTSDWDSAVDWTDGSTEWDSEPERAKKWTEERTEGIALQLERAKSVWSAHTDEERQRYTMAATDGR